MLETSVAAPDSALQTDPLPSSSLHKLVSFSLVFFVLCILITLAHYRGTQINQYVRIAEHQWGFDSSGCLDAAWDAFHHGRPIYESVLFAKLGKFQYPVSSLLIYYLAPLFAITGPTLIHRIVLLSLPVTLLLTGQLFLEALPEARLYTPRQKLLARACIALLGAFFYPLIYGVALGQIQVLQVLLWTAVVLFWMRGKQELSGVCLALICVFKPQFMVFLLWAALRRRWRFFLPFLAALLVIQAISIAVFGWHNQVEYAAVVTYLSRHGEAYYPNQSVNGILQRLVGNADSVHFDNFGFPPFNRVVYLGTTISSILLLSTALFLPMLRRWRDSTLDLLFFGLITTIASPIAWEHHYGYFFAAAVYMMAIFLFRLRRIPLGFQLSFTLFAVPLPLVTGLLQTRFTILGSFEFFAGLGLLASLALLAERTSQPKDLANVEAPATQREFASASAS